MKEYTGVKEWGRGEIEISKSRFITELFPVKTVEEAEECLKKIKDTYKDATHHCYAYVIGENAISMRMSDDGEPQGTAGAPMLEVLKKRGVSDTLAVVTRYFGGIKLGANGLVGAYSRCVAETLDEVGVVKYTPAVIVNLSMDYTHYGKLISKLCDIGAKELDKSFEYGVSARYVVKQSAYDTFIKTVASVTSGACEVEEIERKHYIFD